MEYLTLAGIRALRRRLSYSFRRNTPASRPLRPGHPADPAPETRPASALIGA
ncbi:hypothetical protein C7S13_4344 [Burkholderia cepacia]|nr:hypothetical protein [Burkholderia cepacia]